MRAARRKHPYIAFVVRGASDRPNPRDWIKALFTRTTITLAPQSKGSSMSVRLMFVAFAGVVALAGNAMAGDTPVQQIAVAAVANAAAPVKPIAKPAPEAAAKPAQKSPATKPAQQAAATKPAQAAPALKPAQEAAATKPALKLEMQKPEAKQPEAPTPPEHKMAVREVPVHKPAVPMRGVAVMMDNVALVSFEKPVATVYVGNSSIAELTMVDAQHVFVLGKRFGATNLIALGPDKTVIENDPVTVSSRHADAITVFRGSDTYNYACTGYHCETRPVPGDPKNYFDNTEGPAGEHEDAGTKAASAGGGASQT